LVNIIGSDSAESKRAWALRSLLHRLFSKMSIAYKEADETDWNDDDTMLNFGYDETKPQRGTVDWIGFIDEQQKKYKISDNSLVVKALR